MMPLMSIWMIGDWREPVFDESVAWLRMHADCTCFDSLAAAAAKASNGRYPEAIVLVQSRPGQFAGDEVENLHAREPLARLIALTGPWCEGEQRSGRPIAGVVRVSWRNWRERLPLELNLNGQTSLTPRTTIETERVERMVNALKEAQAPRGQALIYSARLEVFNQIADAIHKLGFVLLPSGINTAPSLSPDVLIFDGWEQVSVFKRQATHQNGQPAASRILLLHFPRPEDHILAREADIDAVVGQPLLLGHLNVALSSTLVPAV